MVSDPLQTNQRALHVQLGSSFCVTLGLRFTPERIDERSRIVGLLRDSGEPLGSSDMMRVRHCGRAELLDRLGVFFALHELGQACAMRSSDGGVVRRLGDQGVDLAQEEGVSLARSQPLELEQSPQVRGGDLEDPPVRSNDVVATPPSP